jgi:hypothetical protein
MCATDPEPSQSLTSIHRHFPTPTSPPPSPFPFALTFFLAVFGSGNAEPRTIQYEKKRCLSNKLGGGSSSKDEEANLLQSLVYPLTEVILGVCRLMPVAQYVPLRLHCVRLLQQLAALTGMFVPTTSLLLGVLDHGEVGMKPLRGNGGGKKGGGEE